MSTPPELHSEVIGDAGRPTLLLLHGIMSSNLQWALNRAALGAHFRLVMVELWGHGESPEPADAAHWQVAGYLAALERLRERLGVQRWLVAGQSFGAALSIRYALTHAARVPGLVITNSRSALGVVAAREARAARPAADTDTAAKFDPRGLPFHPINARRFPADLRARMVASADRVSRTTLRMAGVTNDGLSARSDFGQLRMPVLLVNGIWEKAFQPDARLAAELLPRLQQVELAGGHSINIEQAAAFDTAVLNFLTPLIDAHEDSEEDSERPAR